MIVISVNDEHFKRSMARLLQNVENRRPMMASVAAELLSMAEDNFESESWGGDKWKETHRGGKKLQLSGQLAGNINTQSDNDFARIGSNKKYAAIHHLGGEIVAKNAPHLMIPLGGGRFARKKSVSIPARPYLPIDGSGKLQSDGDKRILDVIKDALAKGVG